MKPKRIYLDNNATTFLDPFVKEALIQFLQTPHGNPSSIHAYGQDARALLDGYRRSVAAFFQVLPQEVIFTSSGTEAMHLLINGNLQGKTSGEIITTDVEHSCVRKTLEDLEKKGFTVTRLKAGLTGAIEPKDLEASLNKDTRLIVVMAANNETGVKNDLESIARIAKQAHVPCVVDGVAILGKDHFTIPSGVTGVGFSGHKIHALQGVGVAISRTSAKLKPVIFGSQEYGLRGGTENLIGIASFTEALKRLGPSSYQKMRQLRDYFENSLKAHLQNIYINGHGPRVSNTSNVAFEGVDGETFLIALDQAGIAASHGSACSAGALEPSPILINMGIPLHLVRSSIRFSLSRFTTETEINQSIEIIKNIISN